MDCDLSQLLQIIQSAGSNIIDAYKANHQTFPSLDAPFNPRNPSEVLRSNPDVSRSIDLAVAAAAQLIATLRDPGQSMFTTALSVSVDRYYVTRT